MLKKTITYKDFNDQTVTEDFYFNLSKAELIEMEVRKTGGIEAHLKRIIATNDGAKVYNEFKNLILQAYGKKSEDGKRFMKSPEIKIEFATSEAYSELIMEMLTDAGAAAAFMNGIVPADLGAAADKVVHNNNAPTTLAEWKAAREEWLHENAGAEFPLNLQSWKLSKEDIETLDPQELAAGMKSGLFRTL